MRVNHHPRAKTFAIRPCRVERGEGQVDGGPRVPADENIPDRVM